MLSNFLASISVPRKEFILSNVTSTYFETYGFLTTSIKLPTTTPPANSHTRLAAISNAALILF